MRLDCSVRAAVLFNGAQRPLGLLLHPSETSKAPSGKTGLCKGLLKRLEVVSYGRVNSLVAGALRKVQ
jgi:hypothetical protein